MNLKYLSKNELSKANRQAIKAGCRAIDPAYVERLPEGLHYPVFVTIPWERHGWVRCNVGTATDVAATDFTLVWLDVPQDIYDSLQNDNEVTE